MNPLIRLSGFLLFWIMLGLLVAVSIMLLRGDLVMTTAQQSADGGLPLAAQQRSFADAVALAAPAVVNVHAISTVESVPGNMRLLERLFGRNAPNLSRPQTRNERTSGSGVIMDAEGYVITNHHVIENAERVGVILADGRSAPAEIVGNDPDTDLAVLKIQIGRLPVIKPSNIAALRIGDVALAIGYPSRIGLTVTQGIISATGRTRISDTPYQSLIQTDAAINPGNSGGALINPEGELIGINTLQSATFQGIGFAIPVDMAMDVYQQIKERGYVVRGWIGLEGSAVNAPQLKTFFPDLKFGVMITAATADGPGYKAGIRAGDIITHIGDDELTSISEIMDRVALSSPGDSMTVKGFRLSTRESFSAEVELGQRQLQSL